MAIYCYSKNLAHQSGQYIPFNCRQYTTEEILDRLLNIFELSLKLLYNKANS